MAHFCKDFNYRCSLISANCIREAINTWLYKTLTQTNVLFVFESTLYWSPKQGTWYFCGQRGFSGTNGCRVRFHLCRRLGHRWCHGTHPVSPSTLWDASTQHRVCGSVGLPVACSIDQAVYAIVCHTPSCTTVSCHHGVDHGVGNCRSFTPTSARHCGTLQQLLRITVYTAI